MTANENRPAALADNAAGRFSPIIRGVRSVGNAPSSQRARGEVGQGQRGQVGMTLALTVPLWTPAKDAYHATKAVTMPR
jgi:hypothetical protein